ncbi:hypothetical protein Btru_051899, partial [Bulinus truncatus]
MWPSYATDDMCPSYATGDMCPSYATGDMCPKGRDSENSSLFDTALKAQPVALLGSPAQPVALFGSPAQPEALQFLLIYVVGPEDPLSLTADDQYKDNCPGQSPSDVYIVLPRVTHSHVTRFNMKA